MKFFSRIRDEKSISSSHTAKINVIAAVARCWLVISTDVSFFSFSFFRYRLRQGPKASPMDYSGSKTVKTVAPICRWTPSSVVTHTCAGWIVKFKISNRIAKVRFWVISGMMRISESALMSRKNVVSNKPIEWLEVIFGQRTRADREISRTRRVTSALLCLHNTYLVLVVGREKIKPFGRNTSLMFMCDTPIVLYCCIG